MFSDVLSIDYLLLTSQQNSKYKVSKEPQLASGAEPSYKDSVPRVTNPTD